MAVSPIESCDMHPARYAIYFTPTDHQAFWQAGSNTIGYDALNGVHRPAQACCGLSQTEWTALTEEPRRYGFHATLKAPFRLNSHRSEDELRAHFHTCVTQETVIGLKGLEAVCMGPFIALALTGDHQPVSQLAMRMVEAFETFRAPLNEAEVARRLRSPLSDKQRQNLETFGYPYVGDEYRFHMTLTGAIADADLRERIRAELGERITTAIGDRPVSLGVLALLKQAGPDQSFRILEHYRLAPRNG